MTTVYVALLASDEDEKIVGVYSTRDRAQTAAEKAQMHDLETQRRNLERFAPAGEASPATIYIEAHVLDEGGQP